ncbi:MAG: hypothetical protein L3J75_06980 [Methylococcaceae bacterium]|nr:hypothetical protein [Methylococcaceae bacterium]
MTELLFCTQPLTPAQLQTQHQLEMNDLLGLNNSKPSIIKPYSPYIIENALTELDRGIYNQLSTLPHSQTKELTQIAQAIGAENTVAIAEVTAKLHNYNLGMIGAATSVYAKRLEGFAGAVQHYQERLLAYRAAVKSNSQAVPLEKTRVNLAFEKMQRNYRHELNIVTERSRALAKRGTPLTDVERGRHIAESSRTSVKLNVMSQVQASHLMKFSQQAKLLSNGLVVIDFGSRVGNIRNSYQAGANWEKELFVESSSFAISATAGIVAVDVGTASLGFLMLATPVGWIGLIAAGVTVAVGSAGVSIAVNSYVKEKAGFKYDQLMRLVK